MFDVLAFDQHEAAVIKNEEYHLHNEWRKSLIKGDTWRILFIDEKYFSLEGVVNWQNKHFYTVSRVVADEQGGI